MSDASLLMFGCGVLFIALAGAYVYLRERYQEHSEVYRDARPVPATRPLVDEGR